MQIEDVRLRMAERLAGRSRHAWRHLVLCVDQILLVAIRLLHTRQIVWAVRIVAFLCLGFLAREWMDQAVGGPPPRMALSEPSQSWRNAAQATLAAASSSAGPAHVPALSLLVRFCGPEQLLDQLEARWRLLGSSAEPSHRHSTAERRQLASVLRAVWLAEPGALRVRPTSEISVSGKKLKVSDPQSRADQVLKTLDDAVFSQLYADGSELRFYILPDVSFELLLQPARHSAGEAHVARIRQRLPGTPSRVHVPPSGGVTSLEIHGATLHLGDTPDRLAAILGRPDAYGVTDVVWDGETDEARAFVYRYQVPQGEYLLVFEPSGKDETYHLARIVPHFLRMRRS